MIDQYNFNDGTIRSRLMKQDENWFIAEWKDPRDQSPWYPWICGTKEFLALTEEQAGKAFPFVSKEKPVDSVDHP